MKLNKKGYSVLLAGVAAVLTGGSVYLGLDAPTQGDIVQLVTTVVGGISAIIGALKVTQAS